MFYRSMSFTATPQMNRDNHRLVIGSCVSPPLLNARAPPAAAFSVVSDKNLIVADAVVVIIHKWKIDLTLYACTSFNHRSTPPYRIPPARL